MCLYWRMIHIYVWFIQDKALIQKPAFEQLWQRNIEESIRQGSTIPFVEEAVLQVSNWGFSLVDIQVQKKCSRKGILPWLKSIYGQAECELTGFLGPIHIWQVKCLHVPHKPIENNFLLSRIRKQLSMGSE